MLGAVGPSESAIALLGNFYDFFIIIYMCFQESRHHLFPAMFARLYLMKAVQQVSSMYFLTHYADPYFVKMLVLLLVGTTCTISYVLHGREGKGTDDRAKLPTLKKKKKQCSCRLSKLSQNRAF